MLLSTTRYNIFLNNNTLCRMMSNHKVTLVEDSFLEFNVVLKGPVGSAMRALFILL